MQREIEFRGISKETGEWVYGDYTRLILGGNIHYYIKPLDCKRVEIEFETVGQYINFKDRNDKKIFEGDTLKRLKTSGKYYKRKYTIEDIRHLPLIFRDLEVIGNIHQNKEQIK